MTLLLLFNQSETTGELPFLPSPRIVYIEYENRGTMRNRWPVKDPDAILDYQSDWELWLGEDDTLASSTFDVPSGLTKESESYTDTVATVWLSGGSPGTTYAITHTITTAAGRRDERTIKVRIAQR